MSLRGGKVFKKINNTNDYQNINYNVALYIEKITQLKKYFCFIR